VRLPRDINGDELVARLARFGYVVVRQSGSHLRLTSTFRDEAHHVTVPRHQPLKVGTLSAIVKEVARYLDRDWRELVDDLFSH